MLPKNLPAGEMPPLTSDARNAVMRVMFPMEPTGPRDWHDVVVRGTGPKLQLWIDGVLLDEEFPIGTTRPATAPRFFGAAQLADGKLLAGFRGLMDHAALWHRALSEAEIAALSGGADWAGSGNWPCSERRRSRCSISALAATTEGGRLHPVVPRRHVPPVLSDPAAQHAQQVGRRPRRAGDPPRFDTRSGSWPHHPVAVPITEQWEAWNGTGGTVYHDGKYWMFYPTPDYDGQHGGIQLVTSDDGEHFTKQEPHPFLPGGDCEVFPDPDPQKKTFHMIKAGKTFGGGLPELRDKTLVAWVSPADLDQHGAGVLTVEGGGQAGQFDSLVLGEAAPRRWMAGSDNLHRTQRDQQQNAEETAKPGEWVQIAAVYAGNTVTLYRNGARYAQYEIEKPLQFAPGGRVILGLRHLALRGEPKAHFRGEIADARVYNTALTDAQIAELRPHEPAGPKPLVWFDFKQAAPPTAPARSLPPNWKAAPWSATASWCWRRKELPREQRPKDDAGALGVGGLQDVEGIAGTVPRDRRSHHAAMCPHWFQWNDWYYFIGGGRHHLEIAPAYGPWTLQSPRRLDNLSVPKTGAFTGNRRIFAGFLGDGGWGATSSCATWCSTMMARSAHASCRR